MRYHKRGLGGGWDDAEERFKRRPRLTQIVDAMPDRYTPLVREALKLNQRAVGASPPAGPADGFVIATRNPEHLSRFAAAHRWQDVDVGHIE